MSCSLADIVKKPFYTEENTNLTDILPILKEKKQDVLVYKEKKEVYGVLSLRDIFKQEDFSKKTIDNVKIKDVVEKDFLTVDYNMPCSELLNLMKEKKKEIALLKKEQEIEGIVYLQDILFCILTEKDKRLEEAKGKFNIIFSNSALAVILTDNNGRIIACNPAAEDLLGFTQEELSKKSIKEIYPQQEWKKIVDQEIGQARSKDHIETRVIDKKENKISVDLSLSEIKDSKGNVIGSMGIMRDITERKLVEAQRSVLLRDLEDKNRELDDFTYIVSHDLKEPLRNVDAFSKFVVDDYKNKLGEEGGAFLERIRANVSSMYNLLENLLKLSRIDRGKNPIEKVKVADIIKEAELRLEFTINDRNAKVVVETGLPEIHCNKVRLTEVFINLISNGIKFNKKDEPRIEVGCIDKGAVNEFYVRDNGPGIDSKFHRKIFGVFQRLVGRKEYEGTGAGLSIVKKVVQVHGGQIWVESELGKGANFKFTIPKDKETVKGRKRLGEILIEQGLITEEALRSALKEQKKIEKRSMSE